MELKQTVVIYFVVSTIFLTMSCFNFHVPVLVLGTCVLCMVHSNTIALCITFEIFFELHACKFVYIYTDVMKIM